MEIILMRHGKPSFIGNSKVTSREMTDWITQYNLSEIGRDTPPESSVALAFSALCVISSPLPRAISSLNALGWHAGLSDDIFREADLPVYCIPWDTVISCTLGNIISHDVALRHVPRG